MFFHFICKASLNICTTLVADFMFLYLRIFFMSQYEKVLKIHGLFLTY